MPNFTISEIATIVLVILIVFGPHRLPEMAQKAGQLVRKARTTVNDLKREFEGEFGDLAEPLKDVRKEVLGMKGEVEASMQSLTDDVTKAKEELEAQMAETKKELDDQLEATNKDLQDTLADPKPEPVAEASEVDGEEQT